MELDLDLIKDIYDDWNSNKSEYDTMYKYYKGETDAISNYKMVTKRSNNKINTNFLKSLLMKKSLILLQIRLPIQVDLVMRRL